MNPGQLATRTLDLANPDLQSESNKQGVAILLRRSTALSSRHPIDFRLLSYREGAGPQHCQKVTEHWKVSSAGIELPAFAEQALVPSHFQVYNFQVYNSDLQLSVSSIPTQCKQPDSL